VKVGDLVKCVHDNDVGIVTDLYECKKNTVVTVCWTKFRIPTQEIVGEWGLEILSSY
jgi:hypothetical protein